MEEKEERVNLLFNFPSLLFPESPLRKAGRQAGRQAEMRGRDGWQISADIRRDSSGAPRGRQTPFARWLAGSLLFPFGRRMIDGDAHSL